MIYRYLVFTSPSKFFPFTADNVIRPGTYFPSTGNILPLSGGKLQRRWFRGSHCNGIIGRVKTSRWKISPTRATVQFRLSSFGSTKSGANISCGSSLCARAETTEKFLVMPKRGQAHSCIIWRRCKALRSYDANCAAVRSLIEFRLNFMCRVPRNFSITGFVRPSLR